MLSEREEIELAALLLHEEREWLGVSTVIPSCEACGKVWLKGEVSNTDEIERIHDRHPETFFVYTYITEEKCC